MKTTSMITYDLHYQLLRKIKEQQSCLPRFSETTPMEPLNFYQQTPPSPVALHAEGNAQILPSAYDND